MFDLSTLLLPPPPPLPPPTNITPHRLLWLHYLCRAPRDDKGLGLAPHRPFRHCSAHPHTTCPPSHSMCALGTSTMSQNKMKLFELTNALHHWVFSPWMSLPKGDSVCPPLSASHPHVQAPKSLSATTNKHGTLCWLENPTQCLSGCSNPGPAHSTAQKARQPGSTHHTHHKQVGHHSCLRWQARPLCRFGAWPHTRRIKEGRTKDRSSAHSTCCTQMAPRHHPWCRGWLPRSRKGHLLGTRTSSATRRCRS